MAIQIYFHLPAKTCRCLPLHKPAAAYCSLTSHSVATAHLNPQAGDPSYLLFCRYFYSNSSGFCDVTVLYAPPALHVAVVC